jgi:signal transduction histidine kinase
LERLAALGLLSASAAHEIKNALIPIKTFVDLLIEENPSSELAEIVRRELARINQLLGQMMRLAKPGTSAPGQLSIPQLLNDSIKLVEKLADDKGVRIEKDYKDESIIVGDRNQLEQVFLNLLLNALEAMEQGGQLSIKSEPDSSLGKVRITISDTGVGMDQQEIEQLFALFFSTKKDGTGLGLAIAKDLVSEHGGSISVKSEPGHGTSFIIALPSLAQA